MSSQLMKTAHRLDSSSNIFNAVGQKARTKVFIPYDGSENSEAALDTLNRAGLPPEVDVLVAVTHLWLPLSPYEITRAVSARRMKLLISGTSSFVPALRDFEEQRVLSLEADTRIRSLFPKGNIRTEGIQDVAAVSGEIVRRAKTWGAELIVMGSKRSPSPHITDYVGPALKVAQEAHCSVRVVRASDEKGKSSTRLMIGARDTASTAQLVQTIADRSWTTGTEAVIVAVNSRPRDAKNDSDIALRLEEFAEKLRAIGLKVSTVIRNGQLQDVLLQEARAFSADCIFIDSNGVDQGIGDRSDGRRLGQVAETLVLGAHCSVEVVRVKNVTDQYFKPAA